MEEPNGNKAIDGPRGLPREAWDAEGADFVFFGAAGTLCDASRARMPMGTAQLPVEVPVEAAETPPTPPLAAHKDTTVERQRERGDTEALRELLHACPVRRRASSAVADL